MRHYFKPAVVATLLLLAVFAPQGAAYCQSGVASGGHFDWAKGWGTTDPNQGPCSITGSVTDSLGNLYILGHFRNDSEWGTGWDAERLLPMAPYGPGTNTINTIIAKINPVGEMVWKKVVHSNNYTPNHAWDIKKIGDSAFACLIEICLPSQDNYTYYLDTLLTNRSNYPTKSMYTDLILRTAFIMFDFEGNILEQHFLYLTYTDSNGNDYVHYYNNDTIPWFINRTFLDPSFDMDSNGNIYICRVTSNDMLYDSINVQDGTISGIKFWVDNKIVGQVTIKNRPKLWYPQIIKFSPHFDTMQACRYIIQKNKSPYGSGMTHTKVDKDGNVYFIHQLRQHEEDTIFIDTIYNIYFGHTEKADEKSFLVQFDSVLKPNWVITLDDSVIIDDGRFGSILTFRDVAFDYDSNLMFLYASTGRSSGRDTVNFYSILTYRGVPLNLKGDAFFMAFRNSSTVPELYSYGRVPSVSYSDNITNVESYYERNTLVCYNNRIYIQARYSGGIHLPTSFINYNDIWKWGLGLIIFDYQGNVIGGEDYDTHIAESFPGPISLHDSTLFLMGRLAQNATFGDIPFDLNGFSQYTYIAKYVDTSFMTPYVRPTINRMATPVDEALLLYPNPASGKTSINAIDEPILEISALSMSGVKALVPFSGNTIDTESLQPGIYILEIVTLHNKYHHKFIKL